jgi:crossover junction endodeoxyribonuclease RuvC
MIALGIDPGTRRIGYGVVIKERNGVRLLDAGLLVITSTEDVPALQEVKQEMDRIIEQYRPEVVGIEKLYFSKNQKTAIAVAQARGVILLSSQEKKLHIKEYSPSEVKAGITGYGSADKKAVLKMVQLILGGKPIDVIDDASDALALAIMASGERFF